MKRARSFVRSHRLDGIKSWVAVVVWLAAAMSGMASGAAAQAAGAAAQAAGAQRIPPAIEQQRVRVAPAEGLAIANPYLVKIPDLSGKTVKYGLVVLRRLGLDVAVPSQPNDLIGSTVPAAGTLVKRGTTIALVVVADQAVSANNPDASGRRPVLVTVPDLAGRTAEQAQRILNKFGLNEGGSQLSPSTMQPVGKILSTTPSAGSTVTRGTFINLIVAAATAPEPPVRIMPQVTGMSQATAQAALLANRLRIQNLTSIPSSEEAGWVLIQRPLAGDRVSADTPVFLSVSDGSLVLVPDLTGQTATRAMQVLESVGLHQGSSQSSPSQAQLPGRVLSTMPRARSTVRRGTPVNLTIAAELIMPRVVGMSQAAAQAALREHGLVAPSLSPVPSTEEAGQVVGQKPAAGEPVGIQSPILLSTSDGSLERVPDLRGQTKEEALQILSGVGLSDGGSQLSLSQAEPAGRILSTTPKAGRVVKRGTAIAQLIATNQAPLPDVVGRTLPEAIDRLKAAGFGYSLAAGSEAASSGVVASQNPQAATRAALGSTVALTLAPIMAGVPTVIGDKLPDAIGALRANGFGYALTPSAQSDSSGVVADQSPKPDTQAALGSKITLTLTTPFQIPWNLIWLIGGVAIGAGLAWHFRKDPSIHNSVSVPPPVSVTVVLTHGMLSAAPSEPHGQRPALRLSWRVETLPPKVSDLSPTSIRLIRRESTQ